MQPPVLAPPDVGVFDSFLSAAKPILPIPALLVVLPILWLLFRGTWRELDADATRWRMELEELGRIDLRPLVAMAACAVILTLQEYYGGRGYYDQTIRPLIVRLDVAHPRVIALARYDELYGFAWWVGTRVLG